MSKKHVGKRHAHGCQRCHVRYEDACTEPGTDGLCTKCRGGKPWQELINNFSPRACCFESSRLVTKEDKDTYRLAGKHIWHICKMCARTHPTRPVREEESS